MSSGEILALVDQDDRWMFDKLEKQLRLITDGADLVFADCVRSDGRSYSVDLMICKVP